MEEKKAKFLEFFGIFFIVFALWFITIKGEPPYNIVGLVTESSIPAFIVAWFVYYWVYKPFASLKFRSFWFSIWYPFVVLGIAFIMFRTASNYFFSTASTSPKQVIKNKLTKDYCKATLDKLIDIDDIDTTSYDKIYDTSLDICKHLNEIKASSEKKDNMEIEILESIDLFHKTSLKEDGRFFKGYKCKNRCKGHKAGFNWAEKKEITSTTKCKSKSKAFNEGCLSYLTEKLQDLDVENEELRETMYDNDIEPPDYSPY